MLSVLTREYTNMYTSEHKKIFGSHGHVPYLDWGDGILMYAYFHMHPIVQVKYVQFLVYRLHLNKAGLFFFKKLNLEGIEWEVSVLSLHLFSKSKIIPNEFIF